MSGKRAPVQGFAAGIPWEMHLRAYDAYCKEYRPQQALIEGGCRGGFSTGELDMFIPGWREELSDRAKDRATIAALQSEIARLKAGIERALAIHHADEVSRPQDDMVCELVAALSAPDVTRRGE